MPTRIVCLVALTVSVGCTGEPPGEAGYQACADHFHLACRAGCVPSDDCGEAWFDAAEADVGDLVETCIGGCAPVACGSGEYFDCACYARCLDEASPGARDAIVSAIECDLAAVRHCGP